jgi:hypothetical protein
MPSYYTNVPEKRGKDGENTFISHGNGLGGRSESHEEYMTRSKQFLEYNGNAEQALKTQNKHWKQKHDGKGAGSHRRYMG